MSSLFLQKVHDGLLDIPMGEGKLIRRDYFFVIKFFSHDLLRAAVLFSHDTCRVAVVANLKISVNSPVLSSDSPYTKFHSVPLISDLSAAVTDALNSSVNA